MFIYFVIESSWVGFVIVYLFVELNPRIIFLPSKGSSLSLGVSVQGQYLESIWTPFEIWDVVLIYAVLEWKMNKKWISTIERDLVAQNARNININILPQHLNCQHDQAVYWYHKYTCLFKIWLNCGISLSLPGGGLRSSTSLSFRFSFLDIPPPRVHCKSISVSSICSPSKTHVHITFIMFIHGLRVSKKYIKRI